MIRGWEFRNSTRIVFGRDTLSRLSELVPHAPVALVTTPGATRRGLTEEVLSIMARREVSVIDSVTPNPDLTRVGAHLSSVPSRVGAILAVGGGSVIDTGKVLAVFARRRQLGGGAGATERIFEEDIAAGGSVPLIAVPTTAGTGSEVTPFATLWDFAQRRKRSVAGPGLFPSVAVLDPSLTSSLPEGPTVSSGLDALSQGLEALMNRRAGSITSALASKAVRLVLGHLELVIENPTDVSLRSKMLEGALLSGIAISSTRTALAHSISYPITAHLGVPHGLACAFTLPAIVEINAEVSGFNGSRAVARLVGEGSWVDLRNRLQHLLKALGMRSRLLRHGFDPSRLKDLGAEMITPQRADNNVVSVTPDDAVRIAIKSWEAL